ncbi:SRPBCC family protein [Leptospira kanakyensis]|uniref:SRPBCC domain-containing protein n=1 Tax=Leptospira kanakyensis TaxID=2484968 RepID=A0A6N4QBP3_9LEPT|nr:SRPBCC domain-containing protein [Leptospira kanakyensis]TGK63665.1 SRPBCC domain-containing protein [Leptospira kanakyensis]TGK69871.1 SRPBCC domain-containing protein [Leptospira kanakyensis]
MKTSNQLNHSLQLNLEKKIHSSLEIVWEILTSPKYIKEYLYGTEVISDWKEGSSLVFKGVWEGNTYEENGMILSFKPPYTFKYTYFTAFFGLPDIPENYSIIENHLFEENGIVTIHLKQIGFTAEDKLKHSEENWNQCLDMIKQIAEKK